MDRNTYHFMPSIGTLRVALRKGSVDRNDVIRPAIDVFLAVALRKGSVDRNAGATSAPDKNDGSLSARGAWIEMV